MALDIDLNVVPVESEQFEDDVARFILKHKHITSIGCLGSVSSLSDANDIDDDFMLQHSSACFSSAKCPSRRKRPATVAFDESKSRRKCPVARCPSRKKRPATVAFDESQSRRKQPITVVNDESLETDTSQSGIKPQTILKANGKITTKNEKSFKTLVAGEEEDGGEEESLAGTLEQAQDNTRNGIKPQTILKANGKITTKNEKSCKNLVAGEEEDGGEEESLAGTLEQAQDNTRNDIKSQTILKANGKITTKNGNSCKSLVTGEEDGGEEESLAGKFGQAQDNTRSYIKSQTILKANGKITTKNGNSCKSLVTGEEDGGEEESLAGKFGQAQDNTRSDIKSQTILKANGKITTKNGNSCKSLVTGEEDGGEEESLAGTFGQAQDNTRSGVVEEPVTKLSLGIQNLNTQLSFGRTTIDSNLYANENCLPEMNKGLMPNPFDWKSAPAPAPAPSKGPKIKCPVCSNFLIEASSTICGHLFCRSCIATAISKQKMCPVCKEKLTKRNFHRIYI